MCSTRLPREHHSDDAKIAQRFQTATSKIFISMGKNGLLSFARFERDMVAASGMRVGLGLAASLLLTAPFASASVPVFVGTNIPWNNFGYDIGGGAFDGEWFREYFASAKQNGSNVARFWLHCDGRAGLKYSSSGEVTGLSEAFLPELLQLAEIASNNSVVLQICLWSFDMCKDETGSGQTRANIISSEELTESYINQALVPILRSLSSLKNVFFEVINEPEWCLKDTPCSTNDCVDTADMQRFIGAIASAIHEKSNFVVTVGSASLKWSSARQPPAVGNLWSDAALSHASKRAKAHLDLYNVHYYDWMGPRPASSWCYDPMATNVSYWKLTDKPVVVAEIPSTSKYYNASELLRLPYSNGFRGSVFWAYNDPNFRIDGIGTPIRAFVSAVGASATYEALVEWLVAERRNEG